MRFCLRSLALLAFGTLLQSATFALELPGAKPTAGSSVTWTLEQTEISANPGDTIHVRIKGETPEGWHTYSLRDKPRVLGASPTVLELIANDAASIEGAITSDPLPHLYENKELKNKAEVFEGVFTLIVPLKIKPTADLSALNLVFKIKSRICDEKRCKTEAIAELKLAVKKKADSAPKIQPSVLPLRSKPLGVKTGEVQWILQDVEKLINAKPGDHVVLKLKAMIPSEWHIYPAYPQGEFNPGTSFKFEPPEMAQLEGKITYDRETTLHMTEGSEESLQVFEEAAGFLVPVKLGALKPGQNHLTVKVSGSLCKSVCKPMSAEIDVIINAPAESAVAAPLLNPPEIKPASSAVKTDLPSLLKDGLGAFLLSAALAGLVSLLTPCVFPMIPITVSFFTKRKHVSHAHAIGDAAIFCLGIILTYVVVGFFFALALGQNARDLATNPYVNLAIFSVFMVMAFSLLGFYELQLPTGLINRLNQSAHGGDTKWGLLLMGLVFTLTSFSCTGPFVGTVMAAAARGNWLWPMLGMTVFSAVFALPFFFLAIFPAMLKSLPKSGGWMNSVKVVMGIVEIAAAMKFLSNVDLTWHWEFMTRPVFVGTWLVLSVVCVVYLLGWIKFPHDTKLKKLHPIRIGFVLLFVAACGFLIADMAGKKKALGPLAVYPPPSPYPPKSSDDWESGLAAGRKACKPVFFDFTGFTCVNCRKMEESMFVRHEIEELMKNYVVVRLYTDAKGSTEAEERSKRNIKTELEKYGAETLPFYAIVAPDGTKIKEFEEGYTTDVAKFKGFLKEGLAGKVTGCDLAASAKPDTGSAQIAPR